MHRLPVACHETCLRLKHHVPATGDETSLRQKDRPPVAGHETSLRLTHCCRAAGYKTSLRLRHRHLLHRHFPVTIPDHHQTFVRMKQRHFLRHSLAPLPFADEIALRLNHRRFVFFHFPATMLRPDQQMLRRMKLQRSPHHSLDRLHVRHETSPRLKQHLPATGHETSLRLKHRHLLHRHFLATIPDHHPIPLRMTLRQNHRRFVFFHLLAGMIRPDQQILLRTKLRRFLHHSLDRVPVAGHEKYLRLKRRRFRNCHFPVTILSRILMLHWIDPLVYCLDPIPARNPNLLQTAPRRFPYLYDLYESTYPYPI